MSKKINKSSLLWFIRSRPYTPVAEIRRRFSLDSEEVHAVRGSHGTAYVGLPERPASLLAQLLQEGRIGVELAFDVQAPVIEGVFPLDLREYRERVVQERAARNGGEHVTEHVAAEDEPEEEGDE